MKYPQEANRFSIRVRRNGLVERIAPPFATYLEYRAGTEPCREDVLSVARDYIIICSNSEFYHEGLFSIPFDVIESISPKLNVALAIYAGGSKEEIIAAVAIALKQHANEVTLYDVAVPNDLYE